ncbi:MAG TPA: TetR/AcrR family transcriptional regulator [bacterium]
MAHQAERPRRMTGEQRREQLLTVASRLFAERGFARTTTRQIARAAGVSEGAMYRHFRGKEDLLLTFVRRAVVRSADDLLAGLGDVPPDDWVRAFLRDRLELAGRNRTLLKVVIGEALFDQRFAREYFRTVVEPVLGLIEGEIARRVANGDFRPVDPALAARSLLGLFVSTLLWGALFERAGARVPGADGVEELAGLFLDGVRGCRPRGTRDKGGR